MSHSLSTDPEDRMGIYHAICEVPERYRFSNFHGEYSGRETWEEYLKYYLSVRGDSDCKRKRADRAFRDWKETISETERHYALARPEDVEEWSKGLLNSPRSDQYAYESYWANIERFYSWLMWHPDHPHVYHPFWMAAADTGFDSSSEMWEMKMASPREGKNE